MAPPRIPVLYLSRRLPRGLPWLLFTPLWALFALCSLVILLVPGGSVTICTLCTGIAGWPSVRDYTDDTVLGRTLGSSSANAPHPPPLLGPDVCVTHVILKVLSNPPVWTAARSFTPMTNHLTALTPAAPAAACPAAIDVACLGNIEVRLSHAAAVSRAPHLSESASSWNLVQTAAGGGWGGVWCQRCYILHLRAPRRGKTNGSLWWGLQRNTCLHCTGGAKPSTVVFNGPNKGETQMKMNLFHFQKLSILF